MEKRNLDKDEEGKDNIESKKAKTTPLRNIQNVRWKEEDNETLVRIVKFYNPNRTHISTTRVAIQYPDCHIIFDNPDGPLSAQILGGSIHPDGH